MLYRALELIYATLGLHPSGDVVMRKYYWSVISRRFDVSNLSNCNVVS